MKRERDHVSREILNHIEVDESTLSKGGNGWEPGEVTYHTTVYYKCRGPCKREIKTKWSKVVNKDPEDLVCAVCNKYVSNNHVFVYPENESRISWFDTGTLGERGQLVGRTRVSYICEDCKKEIEVYYNAIKNKTRHELLCISCSSSRKRVGFNEGAFDKLTPASLYWMGYIAGDGNISTRSKATKNEQMKVSIKSNDEDILEKFRKFLNLERPPRKSNNIVWVYSDHIAEILSSHGIAERKSKTLYVSRDLKQRVDFWRGMIDSDGSIMDYKNYPRISLVSGSKTLIKQFCLFCLDSVGKAPSVSKDKRSAALSARLNGKYAYYLIRDLYSDCPQELSLDRKREEALKVIDRYRNIYDTE